ncbi:MAG: tetratricopeptide repeat protein, partial [Patescibacteria group bacterium]|nr:tetratricopeptide repeat protein [Patescibacteria group bacterium]
DRWFYMPLIGLLGTLGIFYNLLHVQKKMVRIQVAIGIVLIMLLGVRTIARNANWTDSLTLYTHDEKGTQSYDLENSLATQLMQIGDTHGAFIHEQLSVSLFPGQINQGNLAVLYQRAGDLQTAGKYFAKAFSPAVDTMNTFHHDPRTLVYYEEFLSVYRDPEEAISSLRRAVIEYPKLSELWVCLALAEYRAHDYLSAEKAIDSAFSFSPSLEIYTIKNQIYQRQAVEIDMLATGKQVKIQ